MLISQYKDPNMFNLEVVKLFTENGAAVTSTNKVTCDSVLGDAIYKMFV